MAAVLHILAMLATGAVVLFVSFTLLAQISPDEVAGPATAAITATALLALRALRIDYELRSKSGAPELREARNRQRERRGF